VGEEEADVRAIALIRLARDFRRTYKRWLEAWEVAPKAF